MSDFAQRIVFEREQVYLQCHAKLFSQAVIPAWVDDSPDGFTVPAESLQEIGAGGRTFVGHGGPADKAIRRIGALMHASLIRECGYTGKPLSEVAQGSPDEQDQTVFVYIDEGRAVGFLVTRNFSEIFLRCVASESDFVREECRFEFGMPDQSVRGVEGVWVAKSFRGKGITTRLLAEVSAHHQATPEQLAYRLPFTRASLKWIVRAAGTRFLASLACASRVGPLSEEHLQPPCHSRIARSHADEATAAFLAKVRSLQCRIG